MQRRNFLGGCVAAIASPIVFVEKSQAGLSGREYDIPKVLQERDSIDMIEGFDFWFDPGRLDGLCLDVKEGDPYRKLRFDFGCSGYEPPTPDPRDYERIIKQAFDRAWNNLPFPVLTLNTPLLQTAFMTGISEPTVKTGAMLYQPEYFEMMAAQIGYRKRQRLIEAHQKSPGSVFYFQNWGIQLTKCRKPYSDWWKLCERGCAYVSKSGAL